MNPSENLRFEELVSAYLDGGLKPENEYELLQMIEHPDYARAFAELTRLDSEVKGLLATPVADQAMADLVQREINYVEGRQSRRQSRVYQAVMGEIHSEARRPITPIIPGPVHLPTQPKAPERSFFHWTMAVSAVLHAAVIALVITLHFSKPRTPAVSSASEPSVENRIEPEKKIEVAKIPDVSIVQWSGDVASIHEEKPQKIQQGLPLADNDVVETKGKASSVNIMYPDGTKVQLLADSRMRKVNPQEAYTGSKCLYLEHGSLSASVSPQPSDMPMRLITPNAEATVVGTKFTLTHYPGQTHLDVTEGIVRLTRISDGKSVEVKAGNFAIVAAGVKLDVRSRGTRRFVKGINFFGPAIVIDGMPWLSHEQALRDGMELTYNLRGSSSHTANFPPQPPVDTNTRIMLATRVYSMDDNVGIHVPLADGTYEVEMYAMETFKPFSRAFDVEINGTVVQRDVGKQSLYQWSKIGPYRVDVTKGAMRIKILKQFGNPAISGLVIHAIDPKQD